MSKTGVIVALVIALVLAGVLLLGGKGRRQPPPAGPLLGFDPARVAELRVTRADGRFEAVRQNLATGSWDVVLAEAGAAGEGAERPWPVDPGRMRAALRVLSTFEADQDADRAAAVESGAAELRITAQDGSTRTMRMSSRTLGGKVLVEVRGDPAVRAAPRVAWVKSEIEDMLVGTGLREWRSRGALPAAGSDVSRITLKGEKGIVAIARVQGRWGLREPVQEPAEPEAVAKLLAALGNVLIVDFLDDRTPERTGLDKPVAELTIESDQRDADGHVETTRQTLRIGQQADIAGRSVFAALDRVDGSAARTVTVSADALAGLTTDPSAYISRRALQTPAADVGGILVTAVGGSARRYVRDLEGWMAVGEAGEPVPVGKSDADAIAGLLNLLTQLPADAVAMADHWPAAVWGHDSLGQPIASVILASSGLSPLAMIEFLSATGKAGRPQIVAHAGAVWRAYGAAGVPVDWLSR